MADTYYYFTEKEPIKFRILEPTKFLGGKYKQYGCSPGLFVAAFDQRCKGKKEITAGHPCETNSDCVAFIGGCKGNICDP